MAVASGREYNMRVRCFILLVLLFVTTGFAQDMVLINGRVIDGTGKPRILANLRIRDGKVSDIGPVKPAAGEMTLDVKGMIVAPGFIDLQSLSPSTFERDATSLINQGVT